MNSSYISLIAMIVAVFFTGTYLRGEGVRKREVNEALDEIRARQTAIMAQVDEINRVTMERDQQLLSRIDSARTYIDLLNAEEAYTSQKIASFGENISALQSGIDSSLVQIRSTEGFTNSAQPVDVAPSGQ